jgi:HPt (histidine-containing phosphotransfer) domain-containing protein
MEQRGAAHLLSRLVQSYCVTSAGLLNDAGQALACAAPERIASAMQGLKSSSAKLGADRLAQCCARIESLAAARQLVDIDTEWSALTAEHDRVLDALRRLGPDCGDLAAAGALVA